MCYPSGVICFDSRRYLSQNPKIDLLESTLAVLNGELYVLELI